MQGELVLNRLMRVNSPVTDVIKTGFNAHSDQIGVRCLPWQHLCQWVGIQSCIVEPLLLICWILGVWHVRSWPVRESLTSLKQVGN